MIHTGDDNDGQIMFIQAEPAGSEVAEGDEDNKEEG